MNLNGTFPVPEHALFSPSQPSWINYSKEEFIDKLVNKYRSAIGTELHEWAAMRIDLGRKIIGGTKKILECLEQHVYEKYRVFDKNLMRFNITSYGNTLLKCLYRLPPEVLATLKDYVNDAIDTKMRTEVRIDYTENFFGTCDALSVTGKRLLIFDLKTGVSTPKIEQLLIYAALFFLAENRQPDSYEVELRIYHNGEVTMAFPTAEEILPVMNKIVEFDILTKEFEGGRI